jgi:hypothetical protein
MEINNKEIYPRYILGLDISTACIGVCVVKDNGNDKPEILYLGHKTPKIPRKIKGIEALCMRKQIFEDEFIKDIASSYTITDVVIEEPLLSSNNVNTVATLLRFNGMISEAIYRILGIVPNFISSYDARLYSFPELVALRKYNKKGEEYPYKHIDKAIKDNSIVLFGAYPFDVDKKSVMMNMVNSFYNNAPIEWIIGKNNELKKENYDACDALICALAYININHYGLDEPTIISSEKIIENNLMTYKYKTKIWNKIFEKTLILNQK